MTRPRLHPPDPDDGLSAALTDPLSGLTVVFARSTVTGEGGEELPGPAITCAIVGPAGPVGSPVAATPREVAGFALRLAALVGDVPAPRGAPLTVPLSGWSASGSGGPPPADHPPCPACGMPVVDQGEGRRFHTDGTPACASAAA